MVDGGSAAVVRVVMVVVFVLRLSVCNSACLPLNWIYDDTNSQRSVFL